MNLSHHSKERQLQNVHKNMELKDNAANQFNLFNVTSLESATDIFQINSFIPQLLLYQFKTQEWGMCDQWATDVPQNPLV